MSAQLFLHYLYSRLLIQGSGSISEELDNGVGWGWEVPSSGNGTDFAHRTLAGITA